MPITIPGALADHLTTTPPTDAETAAALDAARRGRGRTLVIVPTSTHVLHVISRAAEQMRTAPGATRTQHDAARAWFSRAGHAPADTPPAASRRPTLTDRAGVRYALVGKGRRVHLSPNDDTLCGREVTGYTDGPDKRHPELCAPCVTAAEKRAHRRALADAAERANAAHRAATEHAAEANAGTWRGEWIGAQDDAETLFPVERDTEQGALFADRAAVEPAAVEQRVVEGVVVAHVGTAEGSTPSNASHPDVAAARVPLARLAAATMTDHHDVTEPSETERTVRGYLLDPRGQGRVALYWLEEGRIVRRDDKAYGASLDCLAWTMERAGWTVDPMLRSSRCVFAYRPDEDDAPAVVEPAAPECLHRIAVHPDASGAPIKACARAESTQDVGVFTDEGCTEAYDCAVQAANRAAELNAETDHPGDDPTHTWHPMCIDHRDAEQPAATCTECYTD
ncbi:hypothetical protein ACSMX9_22660 [Streptomyces sp. LE64]|uniref:hypothetical protein n=1 Tax=Streptomyces sp. LE64 TaxID=3448653 RepID=UPI004041620B